MHKKLIIAVLTALISTLVPVKAVFALDPLTISNIVVSQTDKTATITWSTNRSATGKISWGLTSNTYTGSIISSQNATSQAVTILGLTPDTNYVFVITANDNVSEVTSFEQTFKTKSLIDNTVPVLSQVQVAYVTATTATIQWQTDENSSTEIDYGQTTTYGSYRSGTGNTKIHDITITGLLSGAYYHFRAKSRDNNNNVGTWYDMTFTTSNNSTSDKAALTIYNIQPTSDNDPNISDASAVISWWTNKLADGWVRYGLSPSFSNTVNDNPPRAFNNSVTLTGLKPATKYYFEVDAKDVLGAQVHSVTYSFVTKSSSGTTDTSNQTPSTPTGSTSGTSGTVLGAGNCDVNLSSDFGYFGLYYNLTPANPDFETWKQNVLVGPQNNWYNPEYFSFSRVDNNLLFGENFFPVNEGKQNDPHDFTVHWRSIIEVPATATYTYKVSSDDDSWVFIDDILTSDLHGIHAAQTTFKDVQLNAGYHTLEIYYADRQSSHAAFTFDPGKTLIFHPLPDGCTVQDVLDYNKTLGHGYSTSNTKSGSAIGGGQVLGASNTDTSDPYRGYACNPDLGYTRIKALYKTTDSPDIWAILETGQKHYITSPDSFNMYQCDWSRIKTVSRKTLDSYAYASLVRRISNPTVYRLFERPQVKWLKINIPSPTVFISYPENFWGNVTRVNDLDIASYPDVQLIKQKGSADVYLIDGTTKHLIPNETVFKQHQFEWFEVVELNAIHMESYDTVDPLQ